MQKQSVKRKPPRLVWSEKRQHKLRALVASGLNNFEIMDRLAMPFDADVGILKVAIAAYVPKEIRAKRNKAHQFVEFWDKKRLNELRNYMNAGLNSKVIRKKFGNITKHNLLKAMNDYIEPDDHAAWGRKVKNISLEKPIKPKNLREIPKTLKLTPLQKEQANSPNPLPKGHPLARVKPYFIKKI